MSAVRRDSGVDPADVFDLPASLNPAAPGPAPAVARNVGALGSLSRPGNGGAGQNYRGAATSSTVAASDGVDPADVLDLSPSRNPVAPGPAPAMARNVGALGSPSRPGNGGAGRNHGGAATSATVAAAYGVDPADVFDLSASFNPVAPNPGGDVAPHLGALGSPSRPGNRGAGRNHGGAATSATVAAYYGVDSADVVDLSASLNPVAPNPGPVVARHLGALGPAGVLAVRR